MIAWVDHECRSWGAHKRYLAYGKNGYPPRSLLGKLIDEGPGAGSGPPKSSVPVEDDPPSYRAVTVAMARMAATHEMGEPWAVVTAHYFFAGKAKQKAADMGIALRVYWQHLHAGHAFISACEFEHFDRDREAESEAGLRVARTASEDVPRQTESCALNTACA